MAYRLVSKTSGFTSMRVRLPPHPLMHEKVYQMYLEETVPETVFRFKEGTVIYPLNSSRGVLQEDIVAQKTTKKHWGLPVYVSRTNITLYLNNHYWTLRSGSEFAAYAKKAHKVNIT